LAPLVFINGKDTKSAQMFTLAHELAHIWLGESGLTDIHAASTPSLEIERWCNRVAAEVLVPLEVMRADLQREADLDDEVKRLARRFKVSTLVILRRIHDAGGLTREAFWEAYSAEHERLVFLSRNRSSGGNFYLTRAASVSKRFARAVIVSTWEGRSSFTEAFSLLGCRKMSTFRDFGHKLGMSF
jgi:Zn-dependent peptidase ImmA (M78 family)